jgi:hypothetical protein
MRQFSAFDPITVPQGAITTNGINRNEQIVIYNASLACLLLTFPDKTTDVIPPLWVRDWVKPNVAMGDVKYSTLFVVSLVGQPVSILFGTTYEEGEHISSVNTPIQNMSININNATSISNIDQPPFTSIVYGRPVGDNIALGAVNIENSGFMQLGDANYQGDISISGPSGKIVTITNDVITAPAINYSIGSISGWVKTGPFTVTTTATFFNHGLGVVPDFVIPVLNGTSSGGVFSCDVDYATLTSTQVKLSTNSAGGISIYILSIKF